MRREEVLSEVTLFLCGDVMTGRGIDQVLPHPGDPRIHEPYVTSAQQYLQFAEDANGPIGAPVSFSYVWGDALAELNTVRPDIRLINLESSITAHDEAWPKGINYRMNPANIPVLTAAGIDCCCLSNNHTMDFGYKGLADTIDALKQANIAFAGVGENEREASAPAIIDLAGRGRVVVFSLGTVTSGIPRRWAAGPSGPGVNLLPDLSERTADAVEAQAKARKRPGDIVVASIHWGGNWGYRISDEERAFAHRLISTGAIDVVHGHSSHHPKALEVHEGKLIIYGCGDFIDDYEGITGYERYRGDLVLMYLASVDAGTGKLAGLKMHPFQIKNFRLKRASKADALWLRDVLSREGRPFGTHIDLVQEQILELRWR